VKALIGRLGGLAVFAAFAVFATGCASSTRIYVRSTDTTNDGNTLYMMVRGVDGRGVATETYQEAAAKLFADPSDPAVVATQPIFPGNQATVTLEDPEAKDVAIYFFFTQPGQSWRVPLRKPLPAEIYIELGQHQIERIQIRKR
jgi:hypothetical protein